VLTVYDSSMIPNEKLIDLILTTADKEEIPIQYAVIARGGTDGGRIHLLESGVPCVVLGVPTRYIHAATGIINRKDFDQTVKLVTACIQQLDQTMVDNLVAF
jgi:putative aminopeptidase FrvX